MTRAPEPTSRRITPELVATCAIVLAYIIWLFSLPAFPTQDGPVHLYYTHVLKALLSHRATAYAQFYTVKHLLPPYAFYYYALLGLSSFVSLLTADRLIICVYVVCFVFGFRFLARSLGPAADQMTLLLSLLLLNWPLGMGFVNFCLSLSFVFWALGLWLRFAGRAGLGARIGFVLIAVLVMFTHPVPLLVMLAVAGVELLARAFRHRRSLRNAPFFARDVITLFIAACTLGYVKLFTNGRPLQQTAVGQEPGSFATRVGHDVLNYAAEKGLAFLLGPGFELRLYRILLLLVLIIAVAIAVRQFLRDRKSGRWTSANTALAFAVFATVALPLLPPDLNGSHFFAERLLLFIWLLPLLAASGSVLASPSRWAILVLALLAQAAILHAANRCLRPEAIAIATAEKAPAPIASPAGALGLVLEDARPVNAPPGLSFDPYLWATADILRHDDGVMANTPWLDLAIIPLGAKPALPASRLSPADLEFPAMLRNDLMADPAERRMVLAAVSFLVIDQAHRPAGDDLDPILRGDDSSAWSCMTPRFGWVAVCQRKGR